jgi:heterodisulfide reductase subunit A2
LNKEPKKVMVIGGGVAGLTAAWELSGCGIQVELVEKADFLGGHAIQYSCKADDECQQCGACSVEKMLDNVVNASAINIHLAAEVENIQQNGQFKVSLKRGSRNACECGCADSDVKCAGIKGYSKHNAALYAADGTFDPEKIASGDDLEVDAVVVASGFTPFDPGEKPTYRYSELENIITGHDLELCKRTKGNLVRPSDGKIPEKLAFIQCVGSRDERLGHLWCSQVCCPYALRTAKALKHKHPDMEITFFYMDIQNTDNSFPVFYEKCKSDFKFIRNIPVDMYETEDGGIRTRFMGGDGETQAVEGEFDMIVLSTGIMPGADNSRLSETLAIDLNEDGFFKGTDTLNTTRTARDGIFVAGTATGPKTISVSMAHAGETACEVMKYLGRAK